MKDPRSFIVTILALVLIALAIVIVSIWGYRVYFGATPGTSVAGVVTKEPVKTEPVKIIQKESLPIINTDSSSITSDDSLAAKLLELNRLQNEIKTIIEKKKSAETNDDKIEQLEASIQELENKNNRIAEENKRLMKMVNQLATMRRSQKVTTTKKSVAKKTEPVEKKVPVSVSSFNVNAVSDDAGNTTSVASKANRLIGSFYVKADNIPQGELDVVIIKPNGKVLLNSPWESGVFETPTGKKVYSVKLHFNQASQQVNFSIDLPEAEQGIYTVNVYYKGEIIGSIKKRLS